MTPAEIISAVNKAGATLMITDTGSIKMGGNSASIDQFKDIVRDHKAEIIEFLKSQTREAENTNVQNPQSRQRQIIEFVQSCCGDFKINPQQVINGLLSIEDEQDIINGDVPKDSLTLHIELWIKGGMRHISGK